MATYKKVLVSGMNISELTNNNGYTSFDGNYNNLSNKPSLFDGNYNNLSNKPTITNTTYSLEITENNPDVVIGLNPSSGSTQYWTLAATNGLEIDTDESARTSQISVMQNGITESMLNSNSVTRVKMADNAIRVAEIDTNNSPTASNQFLGYVPAGTGLSWVEPSVDNANWSGTDLSITNGGTGKSTVGDARSKSGLDVNQSGHLGYNTRIKILPSDFMQDSDNSTANYALTSANNGGTGRIMSSYLEIIGNWNIPFGFKGTSVTLYGTARAFSVYECNIVNTTATFKGSSTMSTSGGTSNITDVTASTTNYLSIRIDLSSTNDRFYGGYITLARV